MMPSKYETFLKIFTLRTITINKPQTLPEHTHKHADYGMNTCDQRDSYSSHVNKPSIKLVLF